MPGAFYDGTPYSLIFDRQMLGLHRIVASWVEEGAQCLDACCGPGGLAFALAARCSRVEGIDFSSRMIARAELLRVRRGVTNLAFRVADASRLNLFQDDAFAYATVSMGLHEMPPPIRIKALRELLRVARRVIIADFAIPMPRNLAGVRNRLFEVMAGPRHFRHFRDYARRGGLPTLVQQSGGAVIAQRSLDSATLQLMEVSREG